MSGRFPNSRVIGHCGAAEVTYTSGRELLEQVRDLSLGLTGLGLETGTRVALLSENRPEWLFADLAVQAAGAVTVPIYPTLSTEQIAFILRDSTAHIVIVSSHSLYEKAVAAAAAVPSVRAIVVMDHRIPEPSGPGAAGSPQVPSLHHLADVSAAGHRRLLDEWGVARAFQEAARKVQPVDLATIIYTSGTTGEPKGVMLTHGSLVANAGAVRSVLALDETDIGLSFLPLCHAFERLVAYVYLTAGVSLVFAESFSTVGRDLVRVRPTVMTGVPRLFEKLHAGILDKGKESRGLRRWFFDWSIGLASRRGRWLEDRTPLSPWMRLRSRLADRLVFQKVRDRLGGRLRFAVSGGAALPPALGRFFYGAGLPILEGYGLTETAPVLTVTTLDAIRFGTVGRALPGVALRIADDGEILARGPNVMAGYHGRPADTAEALRDGWFHTGDIGVLDGNGYLQITDRKKELIVTSGGKNVAPQSIEAALGRDRLVAEAVVIGEGRHFLSALIVPDFDELGRRLGLRAADAGDRDRLLDRADVRSLYQQSVDAVNAQCAQFERVKKFSLLPRDFSVESGELTPTLKLKRRVIEKKYRKVIDEIYSVGP